jgi:hypothetical protein
MNVHQAFLGFFLVLAVVALAEQTYIFVKTVSMFAFNLSYLTAYIFLWLYGFDLPSVIDAAHATGAYPAIIVITVCITGLKLTGSPRVVPVKAVEV